MKRPYKFLSAFLILAAVFSLITALACSLWMNTVRLKTNEQITQVLSEVIQQYPDADKTELIKILNGKSSTDNAEEILQEYGIDPEKDFIVYENNAITLRACVFFAALCAFFSLIFCLVFILYFRHCKKETEKITDYVRQLNNKNYDLLAADNSENEMSLLKNEIYKTSVTLKEQSEASLKGRLALKDSLSDISHQLKTPLTSIMILLDNIIPDEQMPEEIRLEFLNDIKRSANNISFLTQSILTLSKLDADSIEMKRKPENLCKLIEACVQNTAVPAELKEINVKNNVSSDIILECDFKWLCEALTNIVKNCIEYTPENGKIEISAQQNPLYTKISVEDNGTGIDKADLPHIFERFYKGKNSSDDSVGIGLALAKTIVEKSGGTIYVSSIKNKGSIFTIKLFHKINS